MKLRAIFTASHKSQRACGSFCIRACLSSVIFTAVSLVISHGPAAKAQDFSNWAQFAARCEARGGNPVKNPPRCFPRQNPAAAAEAQRQRDAATAEAQRQRDAAAAAQRQRDANLRQQLIDAESRRHAQFVHDRDAASAGLRGSANAIGPGSAGGLRGVNPNGSQDTLRGVKSNGSSGALRQGRVAAASTGSAACIFDGVHGCGSPVALVVVSTGAPSVPADAAIFVRSIPPEARANRAVAGAIGVYERLAHVRGQIENEYVKDSATVTAHPGNTHAKLQLMADSGRLKVANDDTQHAKTAVTKAYTHFCVAEIGKACPKL